MTDIDKAKIKAWDSLIEEFESFDTYNDSLVGDVYFGVLHIMQSALQRAISEYQTK